MDNVSFAIKRESFQLLITFLAEEGKIDNVRQSRSTSFLDITVKIRHRRAVVSDPMAAGSLSRRRGCLYFHVGALLLALYTFL